MGSTNAPLWCKIFIPKLEKAHAKASTSESVTQLSGSSCSRPDSALSVSDCHNHLSSVLHCVIFGMKAVSIFTRTVSRDKESESLEWLARWLDEWVQKELLLVMAVQSGWYSWPQSWTRLGRSWSLVRSRVRFFKSVARQSTQKRLFESLMCTIDNKSISKEKESASTLDLRQSVTLKNLLLSGVRRSVFRKIYALVSSQLTVLSSSTVRRIRHYKSWNLINSWLRCAIGTTGRSENILAANVTLYFLLWLNDKGWIYASRMSHQMSWVQVMTTILDTQYRPVFAMLCCWPWVPKVTMIHPTISKSSRPLDSRISLKHF